MGTHCSFFSGIVVTLFRGSPRRLKTPFGAPLRACSEPVLAMVRLPGKEKFPALREIILNIYWKVALIIVFDGKGACALTLGPALV